MILPTLRASFGRRDALHLVELLGRSDVELRESARRRLEEDGIDSLLDDPRVLNALLSDRDVKASPELVFYVLIRQSLLEGGVDDRAIADYVASMVLSFGRGRRAYRVTEGAEEEFCYLVDMVQKLQSGNAREVFLVRTHLGNFALWIAGLFPDFLEARSRRRGAPSIRYYEDVGSAGYRMAAGSGEAERLGMDSTLDAVGRHFSGARVALNRVADRYLWRDAGDPVARLLREVSGNAGP